MSQAEDLLNSLSENDISTKTEPHIIVGSNRVITVPSELKRIAVQYDHNIETVTFDCPRYWDDHDMSTMNVYINYTRADNEPGCYIADDVAVDETDTSIMHFSWTISRHVTEAVGPLTILICIKMVDKDGNEVNHWNSERNSEMTVSKGMECGEIIAEKYPDIISKILADMGNLADLTTEDKSSLVAAINEAAESGGSKDAVTYTPQTLTEEQKSQARTNIGAEKAGTAYTKPASGIPKSDLADDVQTSLAKADTALQSQTIPDWNQNDETAPDYVKNRPFYTGNPVETVLVEESTVSFAEDNGLYMAQLPPTFEATVGETYKVSWDGTAYECTCVKFQDNPVIGNLSLTGAGSDTGEPFLIVVDNGLGIAIGTADTSASHTFSISVFAPEVVKIDPKYIRDMYYTGDPVETVLVEESTVSFAEDNGLYVAQFPSTFEATIGETYKVSWDGTTYECTCVDFSGSTVIGNPSIMGVGSDTGEPFVMGVDNGQGIVIGTADTSASHTFSISGLTAPIVKIPAKYIDKNSSGYVVIHSKDTMTQQEAEHYETAIATKEVVFIIWNGMCISKISVGGTTDIDLQLKTQNDEFYFIKKNADGLFAFSNRKFSRATFPNGAETGDVPTTIYFYKKSIKILPDRIPVGVGSTDRLFSVQPNGTKSKAFEVLGNGEAVTPALILYSSTADSTKKFKITVDDSGEPTITDESDSTNTWKPTNLPTVTSSDSGKFLRVSDTGEWVAEMQDGSATDTVVTASASAWSNNTITLSVTGVMTDSKLEIGLSDTATDEQYAAATAAQIRATGSGDGTVTLKAATAPTIDLPIIIRRLS